MSGAKVQVTDDNWGNWLRQKCLSLDYEVSVGIHATEPPIPDEGGGTTSAALIASVHEFGSPSRRIPERSFIRASFDANKVKYEQIMQRIGRTVTQRDVDAEKALRLLGLKVESDMRRFIRQRHVKQGLRLRTLMARSRKRGGKSRNKRYAGRGYPALYDTGNHIVNRIRYIVSHQGAVVDQSPVLPVKTYRSSTTGRSKKRKS